MSTVQATLEPITEDDAFLAHAVSKAHLPTLIMSIIHMTGDTSLLDGRLKLDRPIAIASADPNHGLSDDQVAMVRHLAVEALKAYRDQGCPKLAPLPAEIVRRMADLIAGDTVSDEYLPMMYQEMRLDEENVSKLAFSKPMARDKLNQFRVAIVGAGMMGMLIAIKLDELGIPYTIFEKNRDVGGTWLENTYPGLRVDIPNHFYSYSFERNPDWSQHFSVRDELYAYFRNIAAKYNLRKNIRFGTEVEEAAWSEETKRWCLKLRRDDGVRSEFTANAFVSAVGQLSRPRLPHIPGRETFKGPWSHTSGFDRNMPIAGKRVAVIGTAATALQMVPEIAKTASKLYIFQRTAHWVLPMENYHHFVADEIKWLMRHVPNYSNWYRFYLFWSLTDGTRSWYKIDPDWPHQNRSVNAMNDEFRKQFLEFIKKETAAKPGLTEKVTPNYPPFADRILLDNGNYYRALTRDHVDLVTRPIRSIDAGGITDSEGNHYEVDAIIYATGYAVDSILAPMRVTGRNGVDLHEYWGGHPRAYLGITVPSFPNFFMMWGPGTSGATGGSLIFIAECQARYVIDSIRQMVENDIASMEIRQAPFDDYARRFDEEVATLVFSSPASHSYFKDAAGKVWYTLCWRLVDYWKWTGAVTLSEYHLDHLPPTEAPKLAAAVAS